MVGGVRGVRSLLATVVADLDPSSVPVSSVVGLIEEFDRIERMASAAKTLLARRVEDTVEFRRSGSLSPAEFLAAKAGSSVAAAKDTLATSVKVVGLPVVERALRAGVLSGAQAVTIVDAAATAPGAQARLVDTAKKATLRELRQESLRVKAAADPNPEVTQRRIQEGRYLRTFTDAEGAWNLHARGPVAAGARFEARLKSFIDAEFERARIEGRREPLEAYAFDALAAVVDQRCPDSPAQRENVRHLALLRSI